MKKSAQRRRKYCALAVIRRSQKFRPAADPLPGGAGRPKFNQLETVTTFTYEPSLARIDARNFELSWKQTHPQTNKQDPITIHCAAASAQRNNITTSKAPSIPGRTGSGLIGQTRANALSWTLQLPCCCCNTGV